MNMVRGGDHRFEHGFYIPLPITSTKSWSTCSKKNICLFFYFNEALFLSWKLVFGFYRVYRVSISCFWFYRGPLLGLWTKYHRDVGSDSIWWYCIWWFLICRGMFHDVSTFWLGERQVLHPCPCLRCQGGCPDCIPRGGWIHGVSASASRSADGIGPIGCHCCVANLHGSSCCDAEMTENTWEYLCLCKHLGRAQDMCVYVYIYTHYITWLYIYIIYIYDWRQFLNHTYTGQVPLACQQRRWVCSDGIALAQTIQHDEPMESQRCLTGVELTQSRTILTKTRCWRDSM